MSAPSPLHALAGEAGLQVDWTDAAGQAKRVADEGLRAVLAALGLAADTDRRIAESRARLREEEVRFLSADAGAPLTLAGVPDGRGEIVTEAGARIDVEVRGGVAARIAEPGYHRLRVGGAEWTLAVAPATCWTPEDAAPGRRLWGAAAQVPSLRDERDAAFGDFGAVGAAATALAEAGADLMAISPVHALFPTDPTRYSPYAPSSRTFLNVWLADPGSVGLPVPATMPAELIDWQVAAPERLRWLRGAWAVAGPGLAAEVAGWAEAQGPDLELHALFDALHAHFEVRGWQDWPEGFHEPAGDKVARFAAQHAPEVGFWRFCQWLAAKGLGEAQAAARAGGMAVGLIADLAVGMDPGGSHGWARRDELFTGLNIGAPPDLLGPDGQDWGITGFDPRALRRTGYQGFIDTLRAQLAHAGGVRIDHALGLARLWLVPEGLPSSGGAYITQPLDDLLRIIAIESRRAEAIVIGEDLGTVPEGLRPKLAKRGLLGMRVFWFEQADGALVPPQEYDVHAAAMTGTHDLPTMAGWWRGRDIDWNLRLGRGDHAPEAEQRARRAKERRVFWSGFTAAGTAEGPLPGPEDGAAVADAAMRFVGSTPCELAIVPMEDVAALAEQPNLPGTVEGHPNWRRRLPDTTEALLKRPAVARRLAGLAEARK